jgi:tRNA-intron endonuclease, archaea type
MTKKEASSQKARAAAAAASVHGGTVVVGRDFFALSEKGYGKEEHGKLTLSMVEALYLQRKGKIRVLSGKKALSGSALSKAALALDRRFSEKAAVFADLRDRGLLVKTGFKFGCDFRVYGRGVGSAAGLGKGKKAPGEHTRWLVHAANEGYTCAFQELSRAVRLAHSIRARMLWAVVDAEGCVTYYEIVRAKP